jgi:hypothetical protein
MSKKSGGRTVSQRPDGTWANQKDGGKKASSMIHRRKQSRPPRRCSKTLVVANSKQKGWMAKYGAKIQLLPAMILIHLKDNHYSAATAKVHDSDAPLPRRGRFTLSSRLITWIMNAGGVFDRADAKHHAEFSSGDC